MALWKARSSSSKQNVTIEEEESDTVRSITLETKESGAFLGVEDVTMSDVYTSTLAIPANSVMELFIGVELEQSIMKRTGCLNYSCTPWELADDMCQRQVRYKFDKRVSSYRGEAMSTQQRSSLKDKNGWLIEEVMTIHGTPYGDYFSLHLKYQVENITASDQNGCLVKVSVGVGWLKSTRHQKRISKNSVTNLHDRVKLMFTDEVERECQLGLEERMQIAG